MMNKNKQIKNYSQSRQSNKGSEAPLSAMASKNEDEAEALTSLAAKHPGKPIKLAGGVILEDGTVVSADGKRGYTLAGNGIFVKASRNKAPAAHVALNPDQKHGDKSDLQVKLGLMAKDELNGWRSRHDVSILTNMGMDDRMTNAGGEFPRTLNPRKVWATVATDEAVKQLNSLCLTGEREKSMRLMADDLSEDKISCKSNGGITITNIELQIMSEVVDRHSRTGFLAAKKHATSVVGTVQVTTEHRTDCILRRGVEDNDSKAGRPAKISMLRLDYGLFSSYLGNNGADLVISRTAFLPLKRRLEQPINMELCFLKAWLYFHAALWREKLDSTSNARIDSCPSVVRNRPGTRQERLDMVLKYKLPLEPFSQTPREARMMRMLIDKYPLERVVYNGLPVKPSAVTLPGGRSHGAIISGLADANEVTLDKPHVWLEMIYALAGKYGVENQMISSLHTARELIEREDLDAGASVVELQIPMDYAPAGILGGLFHESGPIYPAPLHSLIESSAYVTSQLVSIQQRNNVCVDISMTFGYNNPDLWPNLTSTGSHIKSLLERLGGNDLGQWQNSAESLVGNCCFSGQDPSAASAGLARAMIRGLPTKRIDFGAYHPGFYLGSGASPISSPGACVLKKQLINVDYLDKQLVMVRQDESFDSQADRLDMLNWLKSTGWINTPHWWNKMSMPGSVDIVVPGKRLLQLFGSSTYHASVACYRTCRDYRPGQEFLVPVPQVTFHVLPDSVPGLAEVVQEFAESSLEAKVINHEVLTTVTEVLSHAAGGDSEDRAGVMVDEPDGGPNLLLRRLAEAALASKEQLRPAPVEPDDIRKAERKRTRESATEPSEIPTLRPATMRMVAAESAAKLQAAMLRSSSGMPMGPDPPSEGTFRPGIMTSTDGDSSAPSGSVDLDKKTEF